MALEIITGESNYTEYQKGIERCLSLLNRYKIEIHTGTVFLWHRRTSTWVELKGTLTGGMYRYVLYNASEKKKRFDVFRHVLVWIRANGIIPDGYKVIHKDGDNTNDAIDNLELVTVSEAKSIAAKSRTEMTKDERKALREENKRLTLERIEAKKAERAAAEKKKTYTKGPRYKEIVQIKAILESFPEISTFEISQRIKCNYIKTHYVVKRIKEGVPLKYEVPGPYTSPRCGVARFKKNIVDPEWHLGQE